MNKLLCSIFFATIATGVSAQKINFTDGTNVWHEKGVISGDDYIKTQYKIYYKEQDTVINGTTYKNMYRDNTYWDYGMTQPHFETRWAACIREDVTAGKVYMWSGTEVLLYDYNRKVNDTIHRMFRVHKVMSVTNITINNTIHRVWDFKTYHIGIPEPQTGEQYYLIEGVGTINGVMLGLFAPNEEKVLLGYSDMTCFANKGITPLFSQAVGPNNFDNSISCTAAPTPNPAFPAGVNELTETINQLQVIPNPVKGSAYIAFNASIAKGTVVIYDILGKTITEEKFMNKEQYDIPVLPSTGVYFFKLEDITGRQVYKGSFVYTN